MEKIYLDFLGVDTCVDDGDDASDEIVIFFVFVSCVFFCLQYKYLELYRKQLSVVSAEFQVHFFQKWLGWQALNIPNLANARPVDFHILIE